MVRLIVGKKGKGKTRHLLDQANTAVKEANGSIVYLDKNSKHMYELNNRIRLIDLSSFKLSASEEMMGFLFGVISQDHDLEQMYLDSFLKNAHIGDDSDSLSEEDAAKLTAFIARLEEVGERFGVDFILSISLDPAGLPAELGEKVILAI